MSEAHDDDVAALLAVKAENARLRALLKECSDRLERAAKSHGNDPETAAAAVEKYRAALSQ